jgi:hypothetical protein
MSRDPLDAAVLVLMDQALSIAVQVAHPGMVGPLSEIGADGAEIAAQVLADHERCFAAWSDSTTAKRDAKGDAEKTRALLQRASLWFTQLYAAMNAGKHAGVEAVALVCEQLRDATRPGHRRFGQALATVRATVPVLVQNRATLEPVSIFAMTITEGERLIGWFEQRDTALRAAALVRKQATKEENEARKELLRTLRDVRRTWTAAASVCAGLPDRRMPELDLRICKAAAGQARGSRKRKGAVDDAPAVAAPVDAVSADGEPPAV